MNLDYDVIRRVILTTYRNGRKQTTPGKTFSSDWQRKFALQCADSDIDRLIGMCDILQASKIASYEHHILHLAETAISSLQKKLDRRRKEAY
jgi:hypothetical protein